MYSSSGVNGRHEEQGGAADTDCEQRRRERPPGEEPEPERPREELHRHRYSDRHARSEALVPRTPRERREHAEERGQVRDPHLPGDLGPEPDDAVDPPVADADEPQGGCEADQAEDDHHDVGRAERQQRERRMRERNRGRPDEVRRDGWIPVGRRVRIAPVEHDLGLRIDLVVEVVREGPVAVADGEHRDERQRREHAADEHGGRLQQEQPGRLRGPADGLRPHVVPRARHGTKHCCCIGRRSGRRP